MAELIDFAQVRDIKINGETIRHIRQIYGIGNALWRKPFEFPAMVIALKYEDYDGIGGTTIVPYTIFPYYACDKNGVLLWLGKSISSNDRYLKKTLEISPAFLANCTRPYFVAYSISNSAELSDFPNNAKQSYVEWFTSDEVSGKIKLYAASGGEANLHYYSSHRRMPTLGYGIYHEDEDHHLDEAVHETDITVEVDTPLITLNQKKSAVNTITSIRTNFDEYKVKYEAATAGKFSKTEYPYLRGLVKIDCKSSPLLGINSTCGMYVSFSVNR